MGFLEVIDPGLLMTIQHLGHPGHTHLGIPVGGAADTLSLRIGNRLVGNPDCWPAIEMTLVGGAIAFGQYTTAVVIGASSPLTIRSATGRSTNAEHARPFSLAAGDKLSVGPFRSGARAYLCVAGGLTTLQSAGQLPTSVIAGLVDAARPLRKGDTISVGAAQPALLRANVRAHLAGLVGSTAPGPPLRALVGVHAEAVPSAWLSRFWDGELTVSNRSNRVGVRLEEPLGAPDTSAGRMVTEGMTWGAVQAPPDGRPIILLCDHPTTGGYPVIACIAAADLPRLGQLRPGDKVRFVMVSRDQARTALQAQESQLNATIPRVADPAKSPRLSQGRRTQLAHRLNTLSDGPTIDLNADLGESGDEHALARDVDLLSVLSSANIACGGHAGDDRTMTHIVSAAIARNVAIGAHPSYPDRANFGRAAMDLAPADIQATVRTQLAALEKIATVHGRSILHLKPHGALYHAANTSQEIAEAIGRAAVVVGDGIVLVGQAGSPALKVWKSQGFATFAEAFADRRYEPDGTLRSRTLDGALITDPAEAAAQAVEIALNGRVRAADGRWIELRADTLCIHSDTPEALMVARAVRTAVEQAGLTVRALSDR